MNDEFFKGIYFCILKVFLATFSFVKGNGKELKSSYILIYYLRKRYFDNFKKIEKIFYGLSMLN